MSMLIYELRDALRRLLRRPGYSLLSIAVLGVGLGLALFVYNLVHALILSPLPYPHPDRLVAIGELRQANGGAGDTGVGIDELDSDQYLLLQHSLAGVDTIGAYAPVGIAMDAGGATKVYEGARFTASMLDLLGVNPLLGRRFTARDETPGAPAVVLIGETLWRQQFGADPHIVGRSVRVDGGWASVIGVLPAAFGFPGRSDMWQPMRLQPHQYDDIFGVARLRSDTTAASLRAAIAAQSEALQRALPSSSSPSHIIAKPLRLGLTPENIRRWVWLMFGASVMVLLLACVNVASLQLVQTLSRRRELALRSALGSYPSRLMLGALGESLWLSLAALGIALPLVAGGNRWLIGMYAAKGQALSSYVDLDLGPALMGAAMAAALISTAIAGLVAAWRASRVDLQDALRDGGKGSGSGFARVAKALVVAEIALTVVLLVGAGTFVRALDTLFRQAQVGAVHGDSVLTARVALPARRYRQDAERIGFFEQAVQRLHQTPGVQSVTAANTVPSAELGSHEHISAEGQARPAAGWPRAQLGIVDPAFLDVYGVRLVEGRFFDAHDIADSEPVAVVDRKTARALWPGREAVGQTLVMHPGRTWVRRFRVVGVIEPLQMDKQLEATLPVVLMPLAQSAGQGPLHAMGLAVRTRGSAGVFAPTLAQVLRGIDTDAAVYQEQTQDLAVAKGRLGMAVLTEVFSALGLVSLLLAAAGLYGVLAFTVEQRTQEIGIRRAIGAGTGAIVRQVGRQMAWQLGLGLALGVVLALPWSRLLADPTMRTRAHDPAVFVPVLAVVVAMTLIAALLPLRRALRVDPVVALRHE